MIQICGKANVAVVLFLSNWIYLWAQSAVADEPVFESFVVENVQMFIVCDALRLAKCSVSTHYIEADTAGGDSDSLPRAFYKDAAGKAAFCVSSEPLLTFSLKHCTVDQVLTEACRLSGKYDLIRRKNRWYVLQRDSELPTTIITRSAFAGKLGEFFQKDHVLKDYFKGASGKSRRLVYIPAVDGQPLTKVFDLVTATLDASYWDYSDSWGYWEYEAETPRNIPTRVDIRFPELFEVRRNPEERDTPMTNQLATATDLDGVTTVCLESEAKRIEPKDPIEKLRLFLRHHPRKFRSDIERVALDVSHVDEKMMKELHGIWQTDHQRMFPVAILNDIEVARYFPKGDSFQPDSNATVCGSGYIDNGIFREPFIVTTHDEKTFALILWYESSYDPKRDSRLYSDFWLMTFEPASDGREAKLTLKSGREPVTYRPLREKLIDKK